MDETQIPDNTGSGEPNEQPEDVRLMEPEEITVLDYFRFKINPKNWGKELLPDDIAQSSDEGAADQIGQEPEPSTFQVLLARLRDGIQSERLSIPQLPSGAVLAAFVLAVAAQAFLEPRIIGNRREPLLGVALYALSALVLTLGFVFRQKNPTDVVENVAAVDSSANRFETRIRVEWLTASFGCMLTAFLLFGGNRFTFFNMLFWIAAILCGMIAFQPDFSFRAFSQKLSTNLRTLTMLNIRLSPWNLLWLAAFAVCVFFRFHQLEAVPGDMFSDHAEKLYDVMDVLNGKTSIFFVRNTGREAFQFYWTALMIKLFGTGISFLSLKVGTALAGLFALPFVYLLGKQLGNRWTGLFAMLLCGMAYWPNVIGRVALRFAFYPMFTAPALFFLFRGLAKHSRTCLIWSGFFLGLGLQGYSAMRIVPLVFAVIFLIYWLFQPRAARKNSWRGLFGLVYFTLLLSLPLVRVTLDMPEAVFYRSLTRLGEAETALSAPAVQIFFSNLWEAVIMPFWDNGGIWVHSVIFRPALDHLSAALFFGGLVLVIFRFVQHRSWQDLCLLFSIPALMLPSVLSIAFPAENPSLNRTGAAMIPILIVAALGLGYLLETLERALQRRNLSILLVLVTAAGLLFYSGSENYGLVFNTWRTDYEKNALNTRQIGQVIAGFAQSIGAYEHAYVIPYPHWVDTRLVGINAGVPQTDYALQRSAIAELVPAEGPLLFLYKPEDTETAAELQRVYPDGQAILHPATVPGREFYSYLVP